MATPLLKLRQLLRLLNNTDYSNRYIAKLVGIAPNTVRSYRLKLQSSPLGDAELDELCDRDLTLKFNKTSQRVLKRQMPDYEEVHRRKSKNKYLTLEVLWEEYKSIYKDQAYGYAQFTNYYRRYLKKVDVSMRLRHYPGEALFVDYAGTLIPWRNQNTGKREKAQVFVAVIGFSNKTFVWASRTQNTEDWVTAHVKAFEFYGGVTEAIIPDNLKAAVIKPGASPILNRSYQDMALHYDTVILPARVRKPQDKAKAEQGVLLATRWITAQLLERTFFSVDEINAAIVELLPTLNDRKLRQYPGNRNSRFEEFERQALKPLPEQPYRYSVWAPPQRVPSDYHIRVEGHWYSVPFFLVNEKIEARVSAKLVEIFHQHKRVASHVRSFDASGFTTDSTHQAPQHLAYGEQGLDYYLEWATGLSDAVVTVVTHQYEGKRADSLLANKACSNLKSLARLYNADEFIAACQRAVAITSPSVKSIRSILRTGLYKNDAAEQLPQVSLPVHENVRGGGYYAQGGM